MKHFISGRVIKLFSFCGELRVYAGTTPKITLKVIYCKFGICDFRLVCFDKFVLFIFYSFESGHR